METIEARYLRKHRASGLKAGDRVRVKRAAYDCEHGWDNVWTRSMDRAVGSVCPIIADGSEAGFRIELPEGGHARFPYFVLEKVTDEPQEAPEAPTAVLTPREAALAVKHTAKKLVEAVAAARRAGLKPYIGVHDVDGFEEFGADNFDIQVQAVHSVDLCEEAASV